MLTNEYYNVVIDEVTYKSKIRTWGYMQRNLYNAHGPYSLIPVDHPKDRLAVLVEDSNGIPIGYLPRPDPQDLRGRVRDTLAHNRKAIMSMAEDTSPVQLELEIPDVE